MGKFGDCLQKMQLHEGRQDSRGSRNEAMARIERGINNYLMECFIINDIVLKREDLARYGLDLSVVELIYKDFEEIVVGDGSVSVRYSC